MKTFRVVANVIRGRYGTTDNVKSDGSYDEEPEMSDEEVEILRGYTVEVYDEVGAGIDEVGLYTIEAEDPDQAIEAFQRATANGEIDFSDMDLVDSEDSIEEEK